MLTQMQVAKAQPKEKPYKLSDGNSLYLLVHTSGSKLWRLRFFINGRENMMGLGAYPIVSIKEAREKRDDIKRQLSAGIDPSLRKKLDKISTSSPNTFGSIADEYLANLKIGAAAEATLSKNTWMLTDLAAPLRNRPIDQITPAEVLDILRKVEKSGRRDSARRLRGTIGSVFRLAIATLRATTDPTYALRGALPKFKVKHRASITDEADLGRFLVALEEYEGWPVLNSALHFLVLTMTRPGDVRHMQRSEVNFEKRLWKIPGERMKMRLPHDVPLSRQAINILREVWPLNENCDLVFPSLRSHKKPLSENAFNSVLRNLGYSKDQATAHGFRSSASTILNERGCNPDVIEAALAHQEPNEVRRAYNRATYLPDRIKLMQQWADLLDGFKSPSRKAA